MASQVWGYSNASERVIRLLGLVAGTRGERQEQRGAPGGLTAGGTADRQAS